MNELVKAVVEDLRFPALLQELNAEWSRETRERNAFYERITPNDKAEFINGEVIMHSPTNRIHNRILRRLLRIAESHVEANNLGDEFGIEKLMIRLTRNDFEPDLCYWCEEKSSQFSDTQMLFPAPDFIVEVLSKSTEKTDRGVKMNDYASHGVQEYWIVDPAAQVIEQYLLDEQVYILATKANNGTIKSVSLPGLVLDVRSIFEDEAFTGQMNKQ